MRHPFILFDLDNTLYPASSGILPEINRRILRFTAEYLNIDEESAEALRSGQTGRYGTTLQWLRVCHGLSNPEPYIRAVHPENLDNYVAPIPALRDMLQNLPGPYALLTNSPREHADRVLEALGIADLFPQIWDLRRLGFRGKPQRLAYERVLGDLGIRSHEAILVDDSPANIVGFEAIGGKTLFVDDSGVPLPPVLYRERDLAGLLQSFDGAA